MTEPTDTTQIVDGWRQLFSALRHEGGQQVVYVVGGVDTGKSTLCDWLTRRLARQGIVAQIDCDPGQSSIGPPGTVGLEIRGGGRDKTLLRYVGSVSPPGHLLQMLSGQKSLAERALREDACVVICDSSGFVQGPAAREFQFQTIDLLTPRHVVALERERELQYLLANFQRRRPEIRRLEVSPAVQPRSAERRRRHRQRRFAEYFDGAELQQIDFRHRGLHGRVPNFRHPERSAGTVVGLSDADGFTAALGVVQELNPRERQIRLLAPPFDPEEISSIHFGSLALPDQQEQAAS